MIKKILFGLLVGGGLLIVGVGGFVLYPFIPFTEQMITPQCSKLWAHRGVVTETTPENTIESIALARKHKFPGAEIDIFYDFEQDTFWVAHDAPYGLPEEERLDLEKVFQTFPEYYFWLDLKDPEKMRPEHREGAAKKLHELLLHYHLEENVFVESLVFKPLIDFGKKGIYTVYNIRPFLDTYYAYFRRIVKYKLHYTWGALVGAPVSAVSMNRALYIPITEWVFSRIPVYLFTVNNADKVRRYSKDSNVKIVLTDKAELFDSEKCSNRI